MVFFYHLSFVFSSSRLCVFFSRGVDKASNDVSRNFNRPSSPVFRAKKQKEPSRGNFSQKQQKKTTELNKLL